MRVREIEPGDYERVAELTVAAYQGLESHPLTEGYERELRDVAGRAKLAKVFVAVDESDAVLGAVTYVPDPSSPLAEHDDPAAASIRMLAVAPEAQGRGLGGILTQACIDQAIADGRAQLVLHSGTWMTAAHRVYRRMGFERDPAVDWKPTETMELWGFRLGLPVAADDDGGQTADTQGPGNAGHAPGTGTVTT